MTIRLLMKYAIGYGRPVRHNSIVEIRAAPSNFLVIMFLHKRGVEWFQAAASS